MHVCLTIPSLSAKNGGPSVVAQNLSEQLAAARAEVTVITRESQRGEMEALPRDEAVKIVRVHANGHSAGGAPAVKNALALTARSARFDIVQDFGIWLPANHAVTEFCRKEKVPCICSTSGMLAPWALRHKRWKKRFAWWIYQKHDLSRATLLAVTSEQELADVRRFFPAKPIALVPNGVEIPELHNQRTKSETELRTAVFLGRIHPVKGLMNLVEAWARVRPRNWRMVICGPDERNHTEELKRSVARAGLSAVFDFRSAVYGREKEAFYGSADLFVLPTFSENFGVAVAEALAAGVPVITTKGAPWEELHGRRCGWWIDIGVEPLAAALREAVSLTDEERCAMGQRGRRLVEEKYSWTRIGKEMRAVYEWVCGRGPTPGCVIR